ncbi:nitrate- and nitrite sensing domain-containing protein [Sulfurimonas sp. NWX79]|uniref:nitrate- and nitrite sensing domain-containing protein n=1 Tax=Sulfurimonas sp. NWX79 TaxID=2925412 RepID=UPI0032048ABF
MYKVLLQKRYKGDLIKSQNVIKKLKFSTFIPLIIITIGFVFFIINSYNKLTELHTLKANVTHITEISKLINHLQQERGLSSGYLGSDGEKFKQKLLQIRKAVDTAFENSLQIYSKDKESYLAKKRIVTQIRKKIDTKEIATSNAFDFFTKRIKHIQFIYLKSAIHVDDTFLNNKLQCYTNLSFMKEALGQIRGTFNGILTQNKIDKELIHRAIHAKGMYDTSMHRYESVASKDFLELLDNVKSSSDYQYIETVTTAYFSHTPQKSLENPEVWFQKTTHVINQFYQIEKKYLSNIDIYITHKINNTMIELYIDILLFLLILFFTFWISLKLKNEIIKNIRLLNEYKNAVDRSGIVSKTDITGKIIYANDRFCSISGYTREELLGKPHNIVRHPDMPKSAFKNMWETILAKKPWYGIVKNKKKNGGSYIVEVTINPILNHDGEIEEFIAIRNDITKVVKLHEDLEHTQEDLIYRMGEIGETRSQETGFHVKRVAKYSELLAHYYGLSIQEITYLKTASPMHDIGKVGIPDSILNKPGKLTQEEWRTMKTHANIGYELFRDSDKPLLKTAAIIAYEHHEKYDGSGYPRGLKGEKIHIYGRITALADVFDALGSDRCYKKAWDDERIFKFLKEERGKHFDPQLVDIFFEHLDEFLQIRDYYRDTSSFMQE